MPSTSLLTEYLASLNKQLANARKRHLATFSAVKAASEMDKKLASFSLRSSQQRITKTEKPRNLLQIAGFVVRPAGFEPVTFRVGV